MRTGGSASSSNAKARRATDVEWPLLRTWRCTPRLVLAWMYCLAVLLVTQFWLLYFVTVAFDEQLELQQKAVGEYLQGLLVSYGISLIQSQLLQEGMKVLIISLISPQMMPDVNTLRVASHRESVRLFLRGVLNAIYGVVILIL